MFRNFEDLWLKEENSYEELENMWAETKVWTAALKFCRPVGLFMLLDLEKEFGTLDYRPIIKSNI